MQTHDETRRYMARVSFIGVIAAILYALTCGTVRFFILRVLYGGRMTFRVLMLGGWSLLTEFTVAAVGISALMICGILSLVWRGRPALTRGAWITAGKITLLSAPVGYIQSLYGVNWNGARGVDLGQEFLFSFAVFAAIFVGYTLGIRGISVNQGFSRQPQKAYAIRVLRNTAILFGVMLASALLLVGRLWKDYGSFFGNMSAADKVTELALEPLRWTLPVVLTVTVGYPLLSLAARWNEAPQGRLLGKGSAVFMWVTLAVAGVSAMVSLSYEIELMNYTALTMSSVEKLSDWQNWLTALSSLLSLWALCLLLSRIRGSRLAVWGVRCLLAVALLRQLMAVTMDMVTFQYTSRPGNLDVYLGWSRVNQWVDIIFMLLSLAALCILTVGLTRHLGVGKGFWAVVVLDAVMVVCPLLILLVWEVLAGHISVGLVMGLLSLFSTAFSAVISLTRSLVGILALARTPAEEVPPPPSTPDGEELPKPRVEDYLLQL